MADSNSSLDKGGDVAVPVPRASTTLDSMFVPEIAATGVRLEATKRLVGYEEPWTAENEGLLRQRLAAARSAAAMHNEAGYRNKDLHVRYGLPCILLPIMMSPISAIFDEDSYGFMQYVNPIMFMVSGVIVALNQFLNPKAKMKDHFIYAGRYADIATNIETLLATGAQYRPTADTYNLTVQMQLDHLNAGAPTIPNDICRAHDGKANHDGR